MSATDQDIAKFLKHTNDNPYAIDIRGPGIPPLIQDDPKPWEGLSCMMSETIGSVLNRDVFGRIVRKD